MIGFCFCRRLLLAALVFCAAWTIAQPGWAQETASPITRSIADITAILDKEKPDPTATAKLRAAAEAQPKGKLPPGEMARFLCSRTQVKAQLGDYRGAIADCEKAVDGAEAVSGLGRAFFYAGTRALLVTNWEVDSLSARDLVTGIFGTLAADPTLSRTEALRRAMLALMDGPGLPGQRTYAHPYFWAAYSVIGDGGGGR